MATGIYRRANPRRVTPGRACLQCNCRFTSVRSQTQADANFCSKKCLLKWLHKYRRKFQGEDAEIAEMLRRKYWDQRQTSVSIAKEFGVNYSVVLHTMRLLGVPTRSKGRKPVPLRCRIGECKEPPIRILHKKNGAWYGRMCKEHLRLYKNAKARYMKSSRYPKISEEERWLRKAKETLIQTRRIVRGQ